MKKFTDRIVGGLIALAGAILIVMAAMFIHGDAVDAQVQRNNELPCSWIDASGTNGFRLSVTGVPQTYLNGTLYSGATTNVAYTNLFKAQFINGLYIGAVPLTQ